jgi:putative selenate reductase molybdopterin-binding subunit
MKVQFTLNTILRDVDVEPGICVRDMLVREGIVSLRNGCDGQGSCGACAILLDGKLVNSCLLVAGQIDGRDIITVDYYSKHRFLTAVQSALIDAGVVQCGYCTPAMVLAIEELLSRTKSPTREEITDALSGIFCRCTGYEQLFLAVELAVKRISEPDYKIAVAPSFREDTRLVGKPSRKVDGARLVRGECAFVEDTVPFNSCVLKMFRSPHAHAYIKDIDVSEAEKTPGVVYILTYKNCPEIWYNQAGQGFPEPSPYDRTMIGRKVLHVGDRVAAVVAETEAIACAAIEKIRVDWDILRPVLSIEDAAAPDAPILHKSVVEYVADAPDNLAEYNELADSRDGKIIYQFPIHGDPHRNIAASTKGGIGDIEKGFEAADIVIERDYESSQVQCTPLEPHVVFCRMEGDRLVIHASTQVPWHLRRIVARVLGGIDENRIRVIKEHVGGGFGSKQDIVLEEVAAYLTWITGRPIYQRFTREEEFIASRTRHVMKMRVKLGAKKDEKLTAVYMDVRANTGPYGAHCLTVPMNVCSKTMPLFLCDNFGFSVTTYYSNIPPTGAYQGYGAPQGSFALQLAVSELAHHLGMDHMTFIQKNRVHNGAMLEILRCLGEGREGTPQRVSSCGLGRALKRGAQMIEWGVKIPSADPDIKIGKGLAIIQQASGLPGLDSANADIKLLSDGSFMLLSGGTDLGMGLDTVTTKFAAEILCVDIDKVGIVAGDTDIAPFDVGAYASSGTFFSGAAAKNAAEQLKAKLIRVAAGMLNENEEDLYAEYPGIIRGPKAKLSYRDIAQYAEKGTGCGALAGFGHFTTHNASFPYGSHFAQVAVNVKTGEVKIQKYYALQDCGTPVNPELALGQIYGGVLKTIGHTLFEEMIIDCEGRCLNATLLDYKVPMIGDIPDDFKAELIFTEDPFGPFGSKSVSEIACNGAAPAIADAIHDAIGVWIGDWPFTPEKVLRNLQEKERN